MSFVSYDGKIMPLVKTDGYACIPVAPPARPMP
jgi:hypothetical protein